jgi:SAM-dependent methyltransferase
MFTASGKRDPAHQAFLILRWISTMCNDSVIKYVQSCMTEEDVRGKQVLEVGSLDVNGSVRSYAMGLNPRNYTGIDIIEGPGVDEICDADHILNRFGPESFDLIISTEMLEHVRNWRCVVSALKHAIRPNGILLITARSRGFYYHAYPHDFWRYSARDMKNIFSDMIIESIQKDPEAPGIFVKARKPPSWAENDLTFYKLHSVVKFQRALAVTDGDLRIFTIYWKFRNTLLKVCPQRLRSALRAFRNRFTDDVN